MDQSRIKKVIFGQYETKTVTVHCLKQKARPSQDVGIEKEIKKPTYVYISHFVSSQRYFMQQNIAYIIWYL